MALLNYVILENKHFLETKKSKNKNLYVEVFAYVFVYLNIINDMKANETLRAVTINP